MLLPKFGTGILGCHQAVAAWVVHTRVYAGVRDKFPAYESRARQVSERFWRLCDNASPPARNAG